MLRIHIDDSSQGPIFVLAGFLASVPKWEEFSEKWDVVLKTEPAIPVFKMQEANDEWLRIRGLSRLERTQKLHSLLDVINSTVECGYVITFNSSDAQDAFKGKFSVTLDKPYWPACALMFLTVFMEEMRKGTSKPISFIFDAQHGQDTEVRRFWNFMMEASDPPFKHLRGSCPRWEREEEVLPLQAADLLAWCMRRSFYEDHSGISLEQRQVYRLMPEMASRLTVPIWVEHKTKSELQEPVPGSARTLFAF